MVYGTIQNHLGDIEITSRLNEGTVISIYLPSVIKGHSSIPSLTPWEEMEGSKKNIKILLIDDEPMILRSSRRVLEKLGYSVHATDNGKDAIEIYKKDHDNFSIVIMDMIMPVMDGSQIFYALQKIDKKVPVIICSGYSKDEKVKELLSTGAIDFIQKPFDIKILSQMLDTYLKKRTRHFNQ
jgi:DNA-binding NtrC family response regulator